jgi:hypothetical protein
LVEQRLEEVMIATVDQRDIDGLATEVAARGKAAEAAADNHHAVPFSTRHGAHPTADRPVSHPLVAGAGESSLWNPISRLDMPCDASVATSRSRLVSTADPVPCISAGVRAPSHCAARV